MASNYTRRISIYINGKEVANDIATIRVEMNKLVSQQARMTIGSKEYVTAAKEIQRLKGMLADHYNQLKATATGWDKMKATVMGGYGALVGYAAAVMGVVYSLKSLYEAGEERTRAEKRLLFAVNGNTEAFRLLKAQQDELMNSTGVDDEAISQIQMLGVASGKSMADVKKITEAAIELASITGMDLQAAFLQLNLTLAGQIGRSLPRLSSDFKGLSKEQLMNGEAIDMVIAKYKGFAAESATSAQKAGVAWKEFEESLGQRGEGAINGLIDGFTRLVKTVTSWLDLPVSQQMEDESIKVNMLASEMTDANTTVDKRNRLYDELIAIAPQVLEGNSKEAFSLVTLRNNLASFNEEQINRIIIQKKQEELDKANEKVADHRQQKIEQEVKVRAIIADIIQKTTKLNKENAASLTAISTDPTKNTLEKAQAVSAFYWKNQKSNAKIAVGWNGELAGSINALSIFYEEEATASTKVSKILGEKNQMMKDLNVTTSEAGAESVTNTKLLDDETGKYKALTESISALEDQKRDLMAAGKSVPKALEVELTQKIYQKKTIDESISEAKPEKQTDAAKAAEDAYKTQLDIKRKSIDASIALMQDGFDKELAQLQEKFLNERETIYHELETNTKLTVDQKAILQKTLLDLENGYEKNETELYRKRQVNTLKFEKELIDLQLEGVKAGSAEEYKLKKEQLDKQMQLDIAEVSGSEEQKQKLIAAIRNKYAKKQADEDEKFSLKILDDKLKQDITNLTDAEQKKLEALKQSRADGEISQKEYNKQLIAIQNQYTRDSLLLSIEKAQKELEILRAAGEDTTQAEAALAELKLKAQEAGTKKESGKTGGWDEWTTKDKLAQAADTAQQIADVEFQISRDNNARILDANLSKLQKERDAELANKHLTEAQKDAINKKYDAKERKMKQDAWKKQHQADITQAWVNLALGVGKAAINIWPVPAIPMMAAAGVAGGLQVAAVTAQKMPEFYVGGYTDTTSSNRQPVGVVHGNEYVVPAEGLSNPTVRQIIDGIEVARQGGNLSRLNLPAILGNGLMNGGFSTQNNASRIKDISGTGNQNEMLDKALQVIDKLSAKLDEPIEARVAVRGRYGINEKMKEDKDSRKNSNL